MRKRKSASGSFRLKLDSIMDYFESCTSCTAQSEEKLQRGESECREPREDEKERRESQQEQAVECRDDVDSSSVNSFRASVEHFMQQVQEIRISPPSETIRLFEKFAANCTSCYASSASLCYSPAANRVTKYMDQKPLEHDYYELVYRPSKRNIPYKNILSTTPEFDDDVMSSVLSVISERSEDRTSHSRAVVHRPEGSRTDPLFDLLESSTTVPSYLPKKLRS